MDLPADLLQRTPEEAVRRVALGFLAEAHAASIRLDDASDAEALHDFRVAVRRLRSTMRAWKRELKGSVARKHRRELKEIQGATGGGRDAEVALLWLEGERAGMQPEHVAGLDWLVARLTRQLRDGMAHAREGLRDRFHALEDHLEEQLEHFSVEHHLTRPVPTRTLAEALAGLVRAHGAELAEHLSRVGSREDATEMHACRIATKRLRYLVEPVRPYSPLAVGIVKRCKRLQDVLGDMNDAHVLGGVVADALGRERDGDLGDAVSGLRELSRRCEDRIDELYGTLQREWIGGGLGELLGEVESLAGELDRVAGNDVEIERKYLLSGRPELPPEATCVEIEQGWLPGERLRERLRRVATDGRERFLRTIKLGQGLRRIEIEEETSAELFRELWRLTEGCRVRKRRFSHAEDGLVWEVDEFLDRELFLAEVELPNEDAEAPLPPWLAGVVVREVTGDPGYVNLNLAR